MLIFASGRTDIAAFYSDWFMNRVREGFVDVRNPYYKAQVTRYELSKEKVDCVIFCTKNPEPILKYIPELKQKFPLNFFVTITPYEKDVEPNVPEKGAVIESFKKLSELIGKQNITWRYDPIFISQKYLPSLHIRKFREYAEALKEYTGRCIISFIDLYEKTKRNFPEVNEVSVEDQKFIARAFSSIARDTNLRLETCAEEIDFSDCGVIPGACVSREIIEQTTGSVLLKKIGRSALRKHCACLPTHDIGAYNCCPHLCKYCYANYDAELVRKNYARHDKGSSFLLGTSESGDIFHQAAQSLFRDTALDSQMELEF